jgi:GAF domain-containing protein
MKTQATAERSMPASLHVLSENALASQAHQLRLQALQGSAWAASLAHDYEVELRTRLRQPSSDTASMSAPSNVSTMAIDAETLDGRAGLKARATMATSDHVATADAASDAMTEGVSRLLKDLRELLEMDIALVAEFRDGHRIFRHVDENPSGPSRLHVGESVPLEGTYCQRVIDGRLPAMIPNTAALPETQGLAATQSLGIGAYLSAPVVLANGEVYGTLCCISHKARSALGCRQADALLSVAALVSAEIEKTRRRLLEH